MADKLGAVLVFKDGMSRRDAAAVLAKIADKLDPNFLPAFAYEDTGERKTLGPGFVKKVTRMVTLTKLEDRIKAMINSFNPEHGGPVWYIP